MRIWTKSKRRNNSEETLGCRLNYMEEKKLLKKAIRKAKKKAWQDLIDTVDREPWGLPHRSYATKAILPWTNKSEDVVNRLMDSLFPRGIEHNPSLEWRNTELDWDDEWDTDPFEVKRAIKKRADGNKAPGPDGIKAEMIAKVPDAMLIQITSCFDSYLKEGVFPDPWKRAKLALIPKGERQEEEELLKGTLPKVRPICLLDEMGKLFERIIAERIKMWMREHPEAELSNSQYGFRENRSTVDALLVVKDIIVETTGKKELVLAISLNIENAFNSIPWPVIRSALEKKGFPLYVRRIIDNYLSNRKIEMTAKLE